MKRKYLYRFYVKFIQDNKCQILAEVRAVASLEDAHFVRYTQTQAVCVWSKRWARISAGLRWLEIFLEVLSAIWDRQTDRKTKRIEGHPDPDEDADLACLAARGRNERKFGLGRFFYSLPVTKLLKCMSTFLHHAERFLRPVAFVGDSRACGLTFRVAGKWCLQFPINDRGRKGHFNCLLCVITCA